MDEYEKLPVARNRCLECGEEIEAYARTDKKFCSSSCRFAYNNRLRRDSDHGRSKVTRILERNYSVLNTLVERGIRTLPIAHLEAMGFKPNYFTSCTSASKGSHVYSIYDIFFKISATKIWDIQRMPLNLHAFK